MTLEQADLALVGGGNDQKRHGRHYTPAKLADFLAERLIARLPTLERVRVLDPACGDGELLLAMVRVADRVGLNSTLELHGYDLDADAVEVARSRAAAVGVQITFETADFLAAAAEIPDGRFDAVITNPPYVRTQQLGAQTAQLLAEQFGLTGRIDLTHPFVQIAPRILCSGGVLALLCSNRFLSTKAGANVRATLIREMRPAELIDLGDTKLFGAAVLPAIVIAHNGHRPASPPASYLSTYAVPSDGPSSVSLFEALSERMAGIATWEGHTFEVKVGKLQTGDTGATPWRMGGTSEEEWFNAIDRATWKSFGQVAKIRVGIKTTADSVFIGDRWAYLEPELRPEQELLLPLTTHHNIEAWRFNPGALSVLYPYRLDLEKRTVLQMGSYPKAMAYLESHRDRLEGRKYVIDGGREWFEIWVPQRPALWQRAKIVFPDISEGPRFALDTNGAVVNGDCYWISLDDIGDDALAMLMLGIANSATAVRFYDHVCGNKLYAGRRRWISQYVSRFPIPDPTTPEAARVVDFVRAQVSASEEKVDQVTLDRLVADAFTSSATETPDGALF